MQKRARRADAHKDVFATEILHIGGREVAEEWCGLYGGMARVETVGLVTPQGRRRAQAWVADRLTAQWVRRENRERGVSPSYRAILGKYTEVAAGFGNLILPPRSPRKGRKWVLRFRRAWAFRLGFAGNLHPIPQEWMTLKASSCWAPSLGMSGMFRAWLVPP